MGAITSTRCVATAEAAQLRAELANVRRELIESRLTMNGVERKHRLLVRRLARLESDLRATA